MQSGLALTKIRCSEQLDMAEPVPWQMTRRVQPTVRRIETFARDLYNFASSSVSQGTDNPEVCIPSMGPHAAGAVPPTKYPEIVSVTVAASGSIGPDYGVNTGSPRS